MTDHLAVVRGIILQWSTYLSPPPCRHIVGESTVVANLDSNVTTHAWQMVIRDVWIAEFLVRIPSVFCGSKLCALVSDDSFNDFEDEGQVWDRLMIFYLATVERRFLQQLRGDRHRLICHSVSMRLHWVAKNRLLVKILKLDWTLKSEHCTLLLLLRSLIWLLYCTCYTVLYWKPWSILL